MFRCATDYGTKPHEDEMFFFREKTINANHALGAVCTEKKTMTLRNHVYNTQVRALFKKADPPSGGSFLEEA